MLSQVAMVVGTAVLGVIAVGLGLRPDAAAPAVIARPTHRRRWR